MRWAARPVVCGSYNQHFGLGDIDYRSYFRSALDSEFTRCFLTELNDRKIPWDLAIAAGCLRQDGKQREPRTKDEICVTSDVVLDWDAARRNAAYDPRVRAVFEDIWSEDGVEQILRYALGESDYWPWYG